MRGSLKDHQLPPELRPCESYEDDHGPALRDTEKFHRDTRIVNVGNREYRNVDGKVERIKGTRINGRRWDFLESWES